MFVRGATLGDGETGDDFTQARMPKYLDYFERVLAHNPHGDGYLAGSALSYADLSMFQVQVRVSEVLASFATVRS